MSLSGREFLQHILDEADYLAERSRDLTLPEFLGDHTLKREFARSLEVIGEATKRLPEETREDSPFVEWRLTTRCSNICCMRTTLNIADDVLYAVKERARREHRPAGDVLSDLARQALTSHHEPRPDTAGEIAEPESFYGFEPLPHRGPAVSNELIDRLRASRALDL